MNKPKTGPPHIFSTSLAVLVSSLLIPQPAYASPENNKSLALISNPSTVVDIEDDDSYILGPGDTILLEMIEIPELSAYYKVGVDGKVHMPRLRGVKVEGLSINGLTKMLTSRYKEFVKDPQIYIQLVRHRPIRIYVGGEVSRPGYYTLSGANITALGDGNEQTSLPLGDSESINPQGEIRSTQRMLNQDSRLNVFPRLFDAIRASRGITPYSDLSSVEVTRNRPIDVGGGKKRTKINFLSLLTTGDESQNIRLLDGDFVKVKRSKYILREQLLNASQTNLTPQFFRVFVTGRVQSPGTLTVPQGSSLNKALLAASPKLLRGKVEFVRFNKGGKVDRRVFSYKPTAAVTDYRNPILMPGDIVRVQDSLFTSSMEVIKEVSEPFVGVYSLYRLFEGAF